MSERPPGAPPSDLAGSQVFKDVTGVTPQDVANEQGVDRSHFAGATLVTGNRELSASAKARREAPILQAGMSPPVEGETIGAAKLFSDIGRFLQTVLQVISRRQS